MCVRIIIADDHQLLIDGLVGVLNEAEGISILPSANNGRQLLAQLKETSADLVILDLNMPELDGIKTLEVLRSQYPEIKILVLTNYNQPQLMEEIKRLGAHGYLLKNTAADVLKSAIYKVISGELVFNEYIEPTEGDNHFFVDDFMKKFQLTRREVEIIRMVAQGNTSKEIGEQLFVSEFTVTTHRRNIMRKLDVKNLAGLLTFARAHGFLVET
ncbi:MAG TPA: response regulator transcription factor [Sphingobacteriaceae bacterium]